MSGSLPVPVPIHLLLTSNSLLAHYCLVWVPFLTPWSLMTHTDAALMDHHWRCTKVTFFGAPLSLSGCFIQGGVNLFSTCQVEKKKTRVSSHGERRRVKIVKEFFIHDNTSWFFALSVEGFLWLIYCPFYSFSSKETSKQIWRLF